MQITKIMRMTLGSLGMVLVLGTVTSVVSAQTSRGTVTGTVNDPTGAVIAGAAVTLTNVDTNASRETTTSDKGFHRFDATDPGAYKISVSASEFGNIQRTDITVLANQTAVVDVDLKLGGVEATISVVETPGILLQTE